jgi:hypothetical protein
MRSRKILPAIAEAPSAVAVNQIHRQNRNRFVESREHPAGVIGKGAARSHF